MTSKYTFHDIKSINHAKEAIKLRQISIFILNGIKPLGQVQCVKFGGLNVLPASNLIWINNGVKQ